MNSLPDEVLKYNIADYLSLTDVWQLRGTSKKIHSRIALCATPPRKILADFSRADDYNNFNDDHGPYSSPYPRNYGFEIPIPSHVECCSMCVSMSWRGQSWGNKTSHLVIMSGSRENDNNGQYGHVVFASGMAPHAPERLEITFKPKRHRSYHLWYTVGGSGGHVLHLKDVTVRALVFDDLSRSYSRACRFLTERGALPPWDDTLNPFLERDRPLAPLLSDLSAAGLPRTLALMHLVTTMLTEFDRELQLYEKSLLGDRFGAHHRQRARTMMTEERRRWEAEDAEYRWNPVPQQDKAEVCRRRRRNIYRRVSSWGLNVLIGKLEIKIFPRLRG